jgi:DNA-binding transcriptional regulator YiaG
MQKNMMHHKAKIPFTVVQEARHQRQRFGKSYSIIAAFFNVSMWTVRDWCEYKTRIIR